MVHRLGSNGDVSRQTPGKLAVFQGEPDDFTIRCETVH